MSNQVELTGAIVAGPAGCCGCGEGTVYNMPLTFRGGHCAKSAPASAASSRTIASPSAFVPVTDVGPDGPVTSADTMVIRTSTAMALQLTTNDGVGGTVVAEVPIDGLMILEFPAVKTMVGLAVKGVGSITYFISGQI